MRCGLEGAEGALELEGVKHKRALLPTPIDASRISVG
jgi:hypothetical protein